MEITGNMKLTEHLALPSEAALSQTSKLDGVRLSPHFSLREMTVTNVKNVVNNPGPEEIENLKRLCGWLEHLRDMYNILYSNGKVPIIINSGFRSPEVNKRVGGSPTSNHLTGCAADIRCEGKEQAIRYACILLDISEESQEPFDELLIEQSAKSIWVHIGQGRASTPTRTKDRLPRQWSHQTA